MKIINLLRKFLPAINYGAPFRQPYEKENYGVFVEAKDETEADEKGDAKIKKLYGECDVIASVCMK